MQKNKKSIAGSGQTESRKNQQIFLPVIKSEDDIKNYLFTPLFENKPNFEEPKNNEFLVMDHKKNENEVLALDFKIIGNFVIVVIYTSNDCVEKHIIIEKKYRLLSSIQLNGGIFKSDKNSDPLVLQKINCCLSDDAEQLILGSNITLFWESLKMNTQNPPIFQIPIVNVKYLTKTKKFVFNNKREISFGSPINGVSLPKSGFYKNLIDFCVNNEETCLAGAAYMGEASFGILFYNLQRFQDGIVEAPFEFPLINSKGVCSICFESGSQRLIICDVNGTLGFVQFSLEDQEEKKCEILFQKKISMETKLCAKIEMGPGDQFLWMMTQDGALFSVLPEFEKSYDMGIKGCCFVQHGDYFALDREIFKVRNDQRKFQQINDRRILLKSELIQKQNESDLDLLLLIWVDIEENAFHFETYDFNNWRLIEKKNNKIDFTFNWLKIKYENEKNPENQKGISLWLRETEGVSQGMRFQFGSQSELKNGNSLVAYQGNVRHNRIFIGLFFIKMFFFGQKNEVPTKFYIFEKSVVINQMKKSKEGKASRSNISLEHPAKVVDAKISKNKKLLGTITMEWIIYIWDLEFYNIVCKFDHQIKDTKLIGFIGENNEYLITNREVIRISSVQRVLLFLSFFQAFKQFHEIEKGKEEEKLSPLLDSVYMKQDKISKEFVENALKYGCLPYNKLKPMEYFSTFEKHYDKLIECMYVLKVNFKDFAYNSTGFDNFIKTYLNDEKFKKCVKCVSAYKEVLKQNEHKIIGAEHFKNALVLKEFNDTVKKQLWKVNENRIYLNLKENEVLPFYAQDDKLCNDFLNKYNKYCVFSDGFDLHLVGGEFLKKNFYPIDVLELWIDGNFGRFWYLLRRLTSVPLFIFFYLICLISLPIVAIFLLYEIPRNMWKWISARFQGNPEERKKQPPQIPDFRRLHIPNLFAQQESKDFLGTLAEKHPSDPVFKNFFIRSILHCKWIDMRNEFFVDMIQFLYFAILLTIEAVFLFPYRVSGMHTFTPFTVSLVMSCAVLALITWNLIQEFIELFKVGKRIYRLGGIWNFFDWMVIIFTIPAFILDIIDMGLSNGLEHDSKEAMKVLMSISIIFTYLKLAGFARGFETTSFLIRMFIQVFVDMRNFIILLFYIVLALSFAGDFNIDFFISGLFVIKFYILIFQRLFFRT